MDIKGNWYENLSTLMSLWTGGISFMGSIARGTNTNEIKYVNSPGMHNETS